MMLIGVSLCVVGFFSNRELVALLGVGLALACFAIPKCLSAGERAAYLEQTNHQREMKERWEKTFECGACGNRFVPETA